MTGKEERGKESRKENIKKVEDRTDRNVREGKEVKTSRWGRGRNVRGYWWIGGQHFIIKKIFIYFIWRNIFICTYFK